MRLATRASFPRGRGAVLLPALLGALVYARAPWNGFALDDKIDLLENRFVTGPLDIPRIFSSEYYGGWGHIASGHYRPLLNLTYKLVAAALGLRPAPYHLLNVALFAALIALTVSVVSRLAADGAIGLVAGLLFAVHPINSESVAAIAGLKELAGAAGGLLALRLFLGRRETEGFAADPALLGGAARAVATFVALQAALLYKETALVYLPLAMAAEFLHARAPRPGSGREAVRRLLFTWPLALAAAVALTLRALVTGGLFRPTAIFSIDNPLVLLDSPFRAIAALSLLPRYLLLYVWPSCLSSDYSDGSLPLPASSADPWVFASFAILAVLTCGFVLALARGFRTAAFGLLAFALAYGLISNVVVLIGTNMAERFFFVPSWGLAVTAGTLLVPAWRAATARLGTPAKAVAAAVCLVALLAPMAARTWERTGDWRSNQALTEAVLRCHPNNVRVLIFGADSEAKDGHMERARHIYEQALRVRPDSSFALAGLGTFLLDTGQTSRAEPLLLACARNREPIAGAVLSLALSYLGSGRREEAFWAAGRVLGARPSFRDAATAHLVRGEVFLSRGDLVSAEDEYRQAIAEDPDDPVAHFNLGRLLEAGKDWAGALSEYAAAEAKAPRERLVEVLAARARAAAALGRTEEARRTRERLRALGAPGAAPDSSYR